MTVGPGARPGVGSAHDRRSRGGQGAPVGRDALARGARQCTARRRAQPVVAPIVLAEVTAEMAIWREEIFGPVVAIRAVADEAAAVAAANDTDAGLCAYVMTRDLGRARRVVRQLAVGMVGVNEGLISTAQAPFGGVKASGYGREGSRHGLDDYLDYQYVMTTALDTP
jgi:succinate-semialdehyde dehydrogenase/glutarate-semialdehyde dehydrogenase